MAQFTGSRSLSLHDTPVCNAFPNADFTSYRIHVRNALMQLQDVENLFVRDNLILKALTLCAGSGEAYIV